MNLKNKSGLFFFSLMAEARKRKREELRLEIPLIIYQLEKGCKIQNLIELLDEGNVRLYCEPMTLVITCMLLDHAGAIFIRIPSSKISDPELKEQSSTYQICVDRDNFSTAFHNLKIDNMTYMQLFIYDTHILISAFDKTHKELKNVRISALTSGDEPMPNDPIDKLDFSAHVQINGKNFLKLLSGPGKEIEIEVEQEKCRLRFTTTTVSTANNAYLTLPENYDGTEFYELLGEFASKLFKKVIEVFGQHDLTFRFGDGYPFNIQGKLECNEDVNFYISGKEQEE